MNIKPNYNPEESKMEFIFTSNLLKKYFPNFYGLIKKEEGVPKGVDVLPGRNSSEAIISFPVDESSIVNNRDGDGISVPVRKDELNKLNDIINVFINGALKQELKTTEFVPLSGYDIDLLQEDIVGAIECKRALCIIKDYSEFLESGKNKTYNFNQVVLEPGTSEWANVAILISEGNLDEVRKIYTPRLRFVEWV